MTGILGDVPHIVTTFLFTKNICYRGKQRDVKSYKRGVLYVNLEISLTIASKLNNGWSHFWYVEIKVDCRQGKKLNSHLASVRRLFFLLLEGDSDKLLDWRALSRATHQP